MSDGGKGDTQRPRNISNEEYSNRWDAIFGATKEKEQKQDQAPVVDDNSEQ